MNSFIYTFVDETGRRTTGAIEAATFDLAQSELIRRGTFVLDLKEGTIAAPPIKISTRGKIQRRELIELCIYIGTLAEAGLSLTAALSEFGEETQNAYLKHIIQSIESGVKNGDTLSNGMARFPRVFSKEFVYLIRAGEETGTIANAFKELRKYLEWLERVNGDIKQATTYPLFVSIALACFVLYLFSSVIPKIALILIEMNLKLPLITKIIVGLSTIALHTWYLWIIAGIIIPVVFKIAFRKSEPFALFIDSLKLRIPVFGGLIRLIIQARFAYNFSVLFRAGISIIENLSLCAGFIGNRVYERTLKSALRDVQEGKSLTEALKKSGFFSGLVIRMFSAGEASGSLDTSLTHAAAYFDEEVPRRVKRVFGVMEPIIILVLIGIIGSVALAIFLPILSISQGLHS